jgi:aminodeoxyfutalosine deaminase
MSDAKPIAYRARWVLPGDRPPIPNGIVAIGGDRILEVREGGEFDVDLGDEILAPGFVNVHAHLDLSDSPRLERPPNSFVDWLKSVVEGRRSRAPMPLNAAAAVAERMKNDGTAVLGDVALGEVAAKCAAASVLAGVTFGEILGHRKERYEPLMAEFAPDAQARGCAANSGPPPAAPRRPPPHGARCFSEGQPRRIGFSVHAPYSTAAEVYRRAWRPRCTHWFESPDEMEFLRTGDGPMKEFLEEIGAWPESAPEGRWYADPWAELLGDPSTWLLVHANFMTPADLEHALRLSNGKPLRIAFCPRTHAAFGFIEYPLEMFLDAGCHVGLGTDSLASNPDLDVWNEAKFVAAKFPQLADERMLRMLTLDGSKALECESDYGSIRNGKRATLLRLRSPQSGRQFVWGKFFSDDTNLVGWLDSAMAV